MTDSEKEDKLQTANQELSRDESISSRLISNCMEDRPAHMHICDQCNDESIVVLPCDDYSAFTEESIVAVPWEVSEDPVDRVVEILQCDDNCICISSGEVEKWDSIPNIVSADPVERVVEVLHCDDLCNDNCMCITSGEVDKWNGIHDLVSANSGAWGGKYDDSWKNSAGLWEDSSEIVQKHSAYWDSAWSKASGYDPNALDTIYRILSGTSAFLNTYRYLDKIHTYGWINGDGTSENPIKLTEDAVSRLKDVKRLIGDLYYGSSVDEDGRRWLSKQDLSEFEDWLKALDDLMFVVDPTMIDYKSIIERMDPRITSSISFSLPESGGGIFIQLNKIWAILRGIERWVVDTTSATVERWNESADRWNWTWDAVDSSADSWNKTASSAAFWNSASTIVGDHYKQWNSAYNIVNTSSDVWNDMYGVIKENSAYWTSGSHVKWEYAPDMNASNASEYNEPNVIYFNEN